ncbi:MAG: hypothetical protein U1E65_07265 [Myxococcota bacterium]
MTRWKWLVPAFAVLVSVAAWSSQPVPKPAQSQAQASALRRGVVGSWRVVAHAAGSGPVLSIGEDLEDPLGAALSFGGDGSLRTQHQDLRWRLEGDTLITDVGMFHAEHYGRGALTLYDLERSEHLYLERL